MLSGGIDKLKNITDWKQYGGAPLLGFNHLLIKAHGRSQAHAVQNAIKVASKSVATGLQQEIEKGLSQAAAFMTAEAAAETPKSSEEPA
jgi:glycerol-3-phosphate acyltransferase PlsX